MTCTSNELQTPLQIPANDPGAFAADLDKWLAVVDQEVRDFRKSMGPVALAGWAATASLLSAPRTLRKTMDPQQRSGADRHLQRPWLPLWPSLEARPIHDLQSHPWTEILRQASADIREELWQVCDDFSRSQYQADVRAEQQWNTYLFYSRGRPCLRHLQACPRTRDVLAQVPHNALHVCFSILEPGGTLTPHTGPTNTMLTAHLGLANCDKAELWVNGETARYRDDDVLVFDDSFVHWARNDGAEKRYTLMITFPHPELNLLERQLIRQSIRTFG